MRNSFLILDTHLRGHKFGFYSTAGLLYCRPPYLVQTCAFDAKIGNFFGV